MYPSPKKNFSCNNVQSNGKIWGTFGRLQCPRRYKR